MTVFVDLIGWSDIFPLYCFGLGLSGPARADMTLPGFCCIAAYQRLTPAMRQTQSSVITEVLDEGGRSSGYYGHDYPACRTCHRLLSFSPFNPSTS